MYKIKNPTRGNIFPSKICKNWQHDIMKLYKVEFKAITAKVISSEFPEGFGFYIFSPRFDNFKSSYNSYFQYRIGKNSVSLTTQYSTYSGEGPVLYGMPDICEMFLHLVCRKRVEEIIYFLPGEDFEFLEFLKKNDLKIQWILKTLTN